MVAPVRRAAITAVVVVALAVVAGLVWGVSRTSDAEQRSQARPTPSADPMPVRHSPSPLRQRTSCATTHHPFAPTSVAVPGVDRSIPVIAPPRDSAGVPGVPPLTTAGAHMFAWDPEQHVRPGDPRGHVLLNAHTWPDGSALGNQLLEGLHTGDRILVRGGHRELCYRVTRRVEVSAAEGYPAYYARSGPPRLAIIVCSGRRLGPGDWENRTIWFAAPRA